MKKILLSLAAFAVSTVAVAQSQRLVLVEHFTQASCGPCAAANPVLETTLNANSTKAIAIKHQVSWPGYDPMNDHYPAGPNDRRTFYGITGVPNTCLDGGAPGSSGTVVTNATINTRYAVVSPFTISVTHSFDANYANVNVTVNVTCTQAVTGANMRLRAGVVEKTVSFATAPGSNGETEFHNVLKQFLPNTGGEDLPEVWTVGQTATYNYSWQLANVYDLGEIAVIAYIQDHGSKAVHQAGYSPPLVVNLPDLAVASGTQTGTGYCNYNLTPRATLTNSGTQPITSCDVTYTIAGASPVVQNWTGNLAVGASQVVTFPGAQLSSGVTQLSYAISNINGSADRSSANNQTAVESFTRLSQTANGTAPTEGFESYAAQDEPTGNLFVAESENYAFVANRTLATTIPNALGGFARTANSLFFDCYGAANGYIMDALFDKVNLTNMPTGTSVTFSYAHKQYSASTNERMELRVSTNCGQTWTSLWNKAGSTLTTSPGLLGNARFWPTATQWGTGSVDISNYIGQPEVVFSFKVTSAYGQHIFLDDVALLSPTGLTEELAFAETIKGFPNPANTEFNLDFSLETSTDVRMSVVDVLGREVMNVPSQSFGEGKQLATLNVANLANGTYFVNIFADGKMSTRRFVVAH